MQDYKLALRMLLKYPGLTIAGGLALAVAIGIGAAWYDLWGKLLSPTIPLPEGERLVWVETRNTLTNQPETRVVRDFLEWRRELETVADLGAYRTDTRNLIVDHTAPATIRVAEMTTAAFRTARVSPLMGRALAGADETPGAPSVVVLGYDVWQRSLGGRPDAIGSVVRLGNTTATVIGVMPDGFRYPLSHDAWTPLPLRASYGPLEGGSITVIGRLAPGVTQEAANAELGVIAERSADAFPATHQNLRPRATKPGGSEGVAISGLARLALTNLPGVLVLLVACLTVSTLIYARTATREAEIAVRSALGASRARIVGQLFVEALVLASMAAAAGLIAADQALRWGMQAVYREEGGAPFWMTPGLDLTTIVYASGLAILTAGLLSVLPALRVTQARVQPHLSNLGTGGATLRFGRVWTSVMIMQVALTAMAIPVAMEGTSQARLGLRIRAEFPSRDYLAARIDMDQPFETEATAASEEDRGRTFAALEQRIMQEPGVVAVTFADRAPGTTPRSRSAQVESSPGTAHAVGLRTSTVGAGFFEAFDLPIVAGRAFHGGDRSPAARTVIVNEAFAREYRLVSGSGSPIGARLRYSAAAASTAEPWFEIVGVVRDLGLDPSEEGPEVPYVFHAASPGTLSPPVINIRVRGNPATLVARLPVIAAAVDPRLYVQEARTLGEWIRRRDLNYQIPAAAGTAVSSLVLFLSALGIFSLLSVSVSRRTREIGLRAALGAEPRHLLGRILSHAMVLMASGIAAGGALLLLGVALAGPTGRPADDVRQFIVWLALTTVVMLTAGLLACLQPARRVLGINPIEALREA